MLEYLKKTRGKKANNILKVFKWRREKTRKNHGIFYN